MLPACRTHVPIPEDDEVLVRVRAASLHAGDRLVLRGAPLPMPMTTGLLRPKYGVPGFDVAGHVEAAGPKVTRFHVGDEVFGVCRTGACAEYACVREDRLAAKPAGLTFAQAAAVPTSAATALRALREVGRLTEGQKVLINGASGGVGTPKHRELADLTELIESGKVMPVIGRIYPLAETPAALRHIETGHARGKVVITV